MKKHLLVALSARTGRMVLQRLVLMEQNFTMKCWNSKPSELTLAEIAAIIAIAVHMGLFKEKRIYLPV